MGQCKLKKPSEFNSFREIFHCGMTILRKTNLGVFIQCQYTRIILKKNMGQSLFKKQSKFQNFNEIFYCGMIRLKNIILNVFMQCQQTRTVLRQAKMRQSQ